MKTFKFTINDDNRIEPEPLDKSIVFDLLEEVFSEFNVELIDVEQL